MEAPFDISDDGPAGLLGGHLRVVDDPGAQGDQRRAETGGADEVGRTLIAENGVIAVVAVGNQALPFLVPGEQAVSQAEVPASTFPSPREGFKPQAYSGP